MTQQNIQLPNGTTRMAPEDLAVFDITGAGSQTLTVTNHKGVWDVTGIMIRNAAGVRRAPSGAVTIGAANANGTPITVVDAAFANGDRVYIRYAYFQQ